MRAYDNNVITYARVLGYSRVLAIFAAPLLAGSISAFAATVGDEKSVTWRSVAIEPDPACSFGTSTEGTMEYDKVTRRFNVTSPATVEVTYTNIAAIMVNRDDYLVQADSPSTTIPLGSASMDFDLIGSAVDHGDFSIQVGGFDIPAGSPLA